VVQVIAKRITESKLAEECVLVEGRVPVIFVVHFRTLHNIDTVNQTFDARLWSVVSLVRQSVTTFLPKTVPCIAWMSGLFLQPRFTYCPGSD
jgi:hypothetical protein